MTKGSSNGVSGDSKFPLELIRYSLDDCPELCDPSNCFSSATINHKAQIIAILRSDNSIELCNSKSLIQLNTIYVSDDYQILSINQLSDQFVLLASNYKLYCFETFSKAPKIISQISGENILAFSHSLIDDSLMLMCENKAIYNLRMKNETNSIEINLIANCNFECSKESKYSIAHNAEIIVYSCQSELFCLDKHTGRQIGSYNVDKHNFPRKLVNTIIINDENIALCIDNKHGAYIIDFLTSSLQFEFQNDCELNPQALWLKDFETFYLSDRDGSIVIMTKFENSWYKRKLMNNKNWDIVNMINYKDNLLVVNKLCEIVKFKLDSSGTYRSTGIFHFQKFKVFSDFPLLCIPLKNILKIYKIENKKIIQKYQLEIYQTQFRFINTFIVDNILTVVYQNGISFYELGENKLETLKLNDSKSLELPNLKFNIQFDENLFIFLNCYGDFCKLRVISCLPEFICKGKLDSLLLLSVSKNCKKEEFITLNVEYGLEIWDSKTMIKLKILQSVQIDSYQCFCSDSFIHVLSRNHLYHIQKSLGRVSCVKLKSEQNKSDMYKLLCDNSATKSNDFIIQNFNKLLHFSNDKLNGSINCKIGDLMLSASDNKLHLLGSTVTDFGKNRAALIRKYGY
ncbi:MAG: hypothetical protein MHMPM18_000051 [Marteilia pararefringens]